MDQRSFLGFAICICSESTFDYTDTGTSSSSESDSHNRTRLKIKLLIIRRLTLSLHSSSQLLQKLLSNNVFLQLILCPLDFTFVLSLKSTPSHLAIYLFVGRRPYVYVDNIFMFLLSYINLLRKIPFKSLSLVLKENNQQRKLTKQSSVKGTHFYAASFKLLSSLKLKNQKCKLR